MTAPALVGDVVEAAGAAHETTHFSEPVFGLMALLLLAVLLLPVSRRINLPHTVLLTIVGAMLGLVFEIYGPLQGLAGDLLSPLANFSITAEAVLFIFLPALVFEAALAIDSRKLMDDLRPILLLAVIGLLLSTVIVGLAMRWITPFPLLVCLLLGAIVSATDPVAVIAIFKDLGAPKRLTLLVEGESLFNDATAIVLFAILSGMLVSVGGGEDMGWLQGATEFFKVFLGGVAVGVVCAWVLVRLLGVLGDMLLVKLTLTVCVAYIAFVLAEHYMRVSGVMATVTAALFVGSYVRTSMSTADQHTIEHVWDSLSFWANSLIFVMIGLAVPGLLADVGLTELAWLVTLLVAAFAARALIVYGLVPLGFRLNWVHYISFPYRSVMYWGGLRGAVSLALALTVYESAQYPDEIRRFIGMMVTGFVLFTLLVNAPTMPLLMKALGLDKLSRRDELMRRRAAHFALDGMVIELEAAADALSVDQSIASGVLDAYRRRARQHAKAREAEESTLSREEWVEIGLSMLLGRERARYIELRNSGMILTETVRDLLRVLDRISDGTKTHAADGYRKAVADSLSVDPVFKAALFAQRYLSYSGPLAKSLSVRYRNCFVQIRVLREMLEAGAKDLASIVDPDCIDEALAIVRTRREDILRTLSALEEQYPDYAQSIQRLFFERVSVTMEARHYQDMREGQLISQEVHRSLASDNQVRMREIAKAGVLEVERSPRELLSGVPFLKDFPSEALDEIARSLEFMLALPGERIISAGEVGREMYFLASGSVTVQLRTGQVSLAGGDFFGEMALLTEQPRTADIVSDGYCQMLVLKRDAFVSVLARHPTLKSRIVEVARQRQSGA